MTARSIPTCVGKTKWDQTANNNQEVHPHVCGENGTFPIIIGSAIGPSPRVWGKLNGIKQPITIKISSTGGEVFSALSIVSAIERAQEKGYEVITMAYACCMSAAVNLLSAGTKRYGQRYTRFMIHDVGSYNFGFQSKEDIKNNYEEHEAIWKLLSELLMKKSKLTKEKLDDIVKHKKEFYFWPEEALELGLIDKII